MKFTISLSLLSLSVMFATLCTADPQQELDDCRKACSDFIPQLQKVSQEAPKEEYDNLIKFSWTTCQYKCYKCALNEGIRVMTGLNDILNTLHKNPPFSQKYSKSLTRTLEKTTKSCYDRWDAANKAGDTTSIFL